MIRKLSQQLCCVAAAAEDPQLGSEDSDSFIFSGVSLLSDWRPKTNACLETTLYQACAQNEPLLLQKRLKQGVIRKEVMELDIHGRVSVQCKLLDLNWSLTRLSSLLFFLLPTEQLDAGVLQRLYGDRIQAVQVSFSGYKPPGQERKHSTDDCLSSR